MGKHNSGAQDNGGTSGYEAKHSGGWDGEDWARYTNATTETVEIPKVDDEKKDGK